MIAGVLLSIFSGLMWTIAGIVMSHIAVTRKSMLAFYAVGSTLAGIIAWAFFCNWSVLLSGQAERTAQVVFWISLSGVANATGLALTIYAMRFGHQGATWSIAQAALVVPFLLAVIIWRDSVPATGWIGVVLVMTAVIIFGLRGQLLPEEAPDPQIEPDCKKRDKLLWPLAAIGIMLFTGISMTLMGCPSRMPNWEDTANIRPPIDVSSTAVVYLIIFAIFRPGQVRKCFKPGIVWGIMSVTAYASAYAALDIMTPRGLAGIVFPITISTSIIVFALYSKYKVKESWKLAYISGLILALAGIAFMAWS